MVLLQVSWLVTSCQYFSACCVLCLIRSLWLPDALLQRQSGCVDVVPPPDDIAVCIARAFIIMCVITSYPILHFCGRSVAGLTFHQQTAQDQGRIGCDLFFLRSGWAPEPLAVSEQQLLLTKHKNSRNHISYLLNRKWNVVGLAGDVGRGCLVRKEHFSFQSFPSFSIDKGRIATTTKQIIWTTRFK